MSGNNSEFHKNVHWRRIREIINRIAYHEGIEISKYDTKNIRCYCCSGDDLKGKYVKTNIPSNFSPFISDNFYEVFEIPKRTNKKGNLSRKIFTLSEKQIF